jgi:hypothetical protein
LRRRLRGCVRALHAFSDGCNWHFPAIQLERLDPSDRFVLGHF